MNKAIFDFMSNDPFARSLGMSITSVEEGFAKLSMTVDDSMVNFHGAMHGGVIFALADSAFALASNSYGSVAVGINVSMNFIKAAMPGDKLIAEASEVSKNFKLGIYQMKVKNESGDLIATAEGMVYRKKDKFGELV
ncbi:phenylacetic acid degradation protein PaaD [Lottiidibacillus patelloidae]|uniref:Phenylacetic acid degradation protein PaaD n=1 Tax=Lottiidibacillus patelloidae TaxID=2670334 RepID=A0A263BYD9_9BACI|nr:hydroxyphenylacetyl-CoA thioesterase PaaI [Lottiidibacillus patelloidae]OZM58592.1 phenylacetic acid degradation protein PaaD [Lottiidibacillus patelloidae]